MREQIIGLHHWLQTPAGKYLLEWEYSQADKAVADIFGYHALQLGMPEFEALRANRMLHQWVAVQQAHPTASASSAPIDLVCDFSALPFPASSLDLVVLPHALEFSADPHATLREVERVLVPEGRVVICGLNPASLWGLRQQRSLIHRSWHREQAACAHNAHFIAYWRLRDWLRLLSLEVEQGYFGCYRPVFSSARWLERFAWMESVGARWWPIFGAAYFLVAVKRVRGMRLLSSARSRAGARGLQSVPVVHCEHEDEGVQQRESDGRHFSSINSGEIFHWIK